MIATPATHTLANAKWGTLGDSPVVPAFGDTAPDWGRFAARHAANARYCPHCGMISAVRHANACPTR